MNESLPLLRARLANSTKASKTPVYRLYVDTSVYGGCFDPEFEADSLRLVEHVRAGKIRLLMSDVVIRELQGAPENVRMLVVSLPPSAVEVVPLTQEIIQLRNAYLAASILTVRPLTTQPMSLRRRWLEQTPLCPGTSATSCDSTRCARTIRSTCRMATACFRSSRHGGCSLTTKPTKKMFDALASKWAIQEKIAEEFAHLSPEEEIEYFRRASERGALGDWWKSVRASTGRDS